MRAVSRATVLAPADARLAEWMADALGIEDARPGPLLTGGNANLTRVIDTPQGRLVLRQPPSDAVSDKAAAGIEREYAALQALAGQARVPRAIGWCDDASLTGQPFSLTGWVEGVAITDRMPPDWHSGGAIDAIGHDLMRALGEVHRVDPTGLVPPRFGKPEDFVARQIARWRDVRERDGVRDLPLLEEIGIELAASVPPAPRAALIHCDYHLDNCLAHRDRPEIAAIIDWEMATLGDPRVDLGLALFFWGRDLGAPLGFAAIQAISNHPGSPSRDALANSWSAVTGLAADRLDWFRAFAAWRLAAIVEGAFVLQRQGKVNTAYARGLERDVPCLLAEAAAILDGSAR